MKKVSLLALSALMSVIAFAQNEGGAKIDVNVNKNNGNWYASPWIWIVGAAVFILLLVALTRGRDRS
jgi:uncharacterized protein YdeI (BOF family)